VPHLAFLIFWSRRDLSVAVNDPSTVQCRPLICLPSESVTVRGTSDRVGVSVYVKWDERREHFAIGASFVTGGAPTLSVTIEAGGGEGYKARTGIRSIRERDSFPLSGKLRLFVPAYKGLF